MIPTDELIFFRGVGIPPTRFNFGASNFGQSHPFRYDKDQKSSINGGGFHHSKDDGGLRNHRKRPIFGPFSR